MGNKSEPPACVKDGWWQGRCFCLEKMGLLCSTAVVAEKPGNMSDRKCLLTSSNLSLPSLSPSCPPSPVYSSILLSHNIFLFLSSPPHLSFPSTSFFLSLFLSVFSLCLSIPGSVFPLCLVFFFFFPVFLSVFFILPHAPSISFPLSQPPMTSATRFSTRVGQKEGQDSFCDFLRLKVSWQGQIEKQPTC